MLIRTYYKLMNRWLFAFLLFWIAICVACVYSIANAKVVEEKVIQTDEVEIISLSGTDWSNPDNVQGTPGEFFISQEGFLCQSQLVNYWSHGVQQSGRMCRLPNGAWRVLN
jgi:hypothetical protein